MSNRIEEVRSTHETLRDEIATFAEKDELTAEEEARFDEAVTEFEAVQAELLDRLRARPFEDDPGLVREIITGGCEQAREVARETLDEVRQVMGLGYR